MEYGSGLEFHGPQVGAKRLGFNQTNMLAVSSALAIEMLHYLM